jgi:hypothetical protein
MARQKNPPGQTATEIDLNAVLTRQAAARAARSRQAHQEMRARQEARREAQLQGTKKRYAEQRAAAADGS